MNTEKFNWLRKHNIVVQITIVVIIMMMVLYSLNRLFQITNAAILLYFFVSWCMCYVFYFFTATHFRIYYLTSTKTGIILLLCIAMILPLLWVKYNNFIFANVLAIIMVISIFMSFGLLKIPLKYVITLGVGLVLYDGLAVFATDVMVSTAKTARQNYLPVMIYVPNISNIWNTPAYSLGLGDIVFPGLIAQAEFIRAKENDFPKIFNMSQFLDILLVFLERSQPLKYFT